MLPDTAHKPVGSRSRTRRGCACAALAATIALVGASPAQASNQTRTVDPVRTTKTEVAFKLRGIDPASVIAARANFFASKRRNKARQRAVGVSRTVGVRRVRAALRTQRALRLRKPTYVRRGNLQITFVNTRPFEPPRGCAFDGPALAATGCEVAFEDSGAGDPGAVWGSVDCETQGRVSSQPSGDPRAKADGTAQQSASFRRLTVIDGDDFWGERCELGLNDHRTGPTALYHEGERRITFISVRLPESYPLMDDKWQTVMQMKQAQPAANGGGAPVLEFNARGGEWLMVSDWEGVWSAPAQQGVWTRFAFDIRYSQDPSVGTMTVYADLNGDGDARDSGEQSPIMHMATLRRETTGGSSTDGIAPGESIPSHLRMGVYHDAGIACGSGCAVDIDNVEVLAVPD